MFDAAEKLKREFTDKYVVVDASRPELARFKGLTGQVKTVNMTGRALVQFDAWNNIGWYDIGVDFLKVVPKPEPKPGEEKPAKKPAAAKPQTSADSPAVAPNPVGAVPPAPAGEKKMSVAEMLRAQAAAKKAGGAAPAPAAAPEKKEEPAVAAKPQAAVEPPPAPPEKKEEPKPAAAPPAAEGKKLSTAEILAALRKKP